MNLQGATMQTVLQQAEALSAEWSAGQFDWVQANA